MSYDELLRDMERALVAIDASKPYRYQPTTSLPALSPQMKAALGAEAEMVASVVKRARDFAAELAEARVEMERLRGMVDDIEVESGHCHFLDDEEHEPPHLPDHVRAIVQERDALRADLREAEQELLAARAEIERLREDGNTTAMDLVDERDDARADLREAVELLRVFGFCTEADPDHELLLVERRQKLLDRHP